MAPGITNRVFFKTLSMRFYCKRFNEDNHARHGMVLVTAPVFKFMMSLVSTLNESWQKIQATGRKVPTIGLFSHTISHLFPFVPQPNIVSHGFCSAKLPSFLCILVTSDPPRCPTEPYYANFLLTTSSDSFGPERGLLRPVFAFARVAMESVFAHAQNSSNRSYFNKCNGENKKRIQQNEKMPIYVL
jgi:hypothetical protein